MFYEAIHQKYKEYNDLTAQMEYGCTEQMEKNARNLLIALVFLLMVFLVMFMLALYYAFKCSVIHKWGAYVPVMLVIGMMLPRIGGFIIIGTVVYGSLTCGSICDAPADFGRSFV